MIKGNEFAKLFSEVRGQEVEEKQEKVAKRTAAGLGAAAATAGVVKHVAFKKGLDKAKEVVPEIVQTHRAAKRAIVGRPLSQKEQEAIKGVVNVKNGRINFGVKLPRLQRAQSVSVDEMRRINNLSNKEVERLGKPVEKFNKIIKGSRSAEIALGTAALGTAGYAAYKHFKNKKKESDKIKD